MTTVPDPSPSIAADPHPACPMCGGPGHTAYAGLADPTGNVAGAWDLKACDDPACGLGWLDPMPREADIAKAYRTYYTHADAPPAAPPPPAPGLKARARGAAIAAASGPYDAFVRLAGLEAERARMRLMYLDRRPPGRLLEVGSGGGRHRGWLAAEGWRVEGQDVDPQAVERLRASLGVPVHLGPVASLGLEAGGYDAVVLNHVLEHVHDPRAMLRELRRLLRPGGRLVAATPNFASYGRVAAFGRSWIGIDAPRHLHHFRAPHLERLAREAGFAQAACRTTSANAELLGGMSLALAHGGGPSLKRDWAAKAYQVRAWLAHRRDPGCGEELVLEADA